MSGTNKEQYDQFHQKSIEELAQAISRTTKDNPNDKLMRLVYEQKTIEKQDEYNKQQIELQHLKNTELVKEQVKWVKYSALITALATISAALLGWYLADKSQEIKEQLRLKAELLQQIELRTKSTTLGTLPAQTPDTAPLPPPSK